MAPWFRQLTSLATLATAPLTPAVHEGFTNTTISTLRTNLLDVAKASWEKGTAAEALIELNATSYSVFSKDAFPPPETLPTSQNASDVLKIVDDVLAVKPATSKPLVDGQGSIADPASLGTAVLVANWTRTDADNDTYALAASQQLDYLLNDAIRSPDGAISHRVEEVSLWADSVYMVPPFLAYYGALTGNKTILQESFDQVRLYRDALRDEKTGLWRHTALGNSTDDNLWATGNAWAAAGALRVLQALNHSTEAKHFQDQQGNLTEWIVEITSAAWSFQAENGTLLNVLNNASSFGETSATALLAATTYRLASITHNSTLIPAANKAFELVKDSINEEGWLVGTVDPITFYTQSAEGSYSAEAQAFALLLQSSWKAYNDLVEKSSDSINTADVGDYSQLGYAWMMSNDLLPSYKQHKTTLIYNWGETGPDVEGFEFVPMLWGQNNKDAFIAATNKKTPKFALGPNEPEIHNNLGLSSGLSVDDVVKLYWDALEPLRLKGVHILTPAVTSGDAGFTWMQEFIQKCGECKFSGQALHWYDTTADNAIAHFKRHHDEFKLPIYNTEIAFNNFNGGNQLSKDQAFSEMGKFNDWVKGDGSDFMKVVMYFGFQGDMVNVSPTLQLIDTGSNLPNDLGRSVINSLGQ